MTKHSNFIVKRDDSDFVFRKNLHTYLHLCGKGSAFSFEIKLKFFIWLFVLGTRVKVQSKYNLCNTILGQLLFQNISHC
jgi:hypothetical protein